MMAEFIIPQLVFCGVIVTEVIYLLFRYRSRVAKPAEAKAYSYSRFN